MSRILDMARPAGEPEKTHASTAPVDLAPLGLRPFGLRALNAMQLEKNFGGYAHNSGASMAMGYVPKEHASSQGSWQIEPLGEKFDARIQHAPIWDADAARMRT
jgi:glycine cleavage system aminomethyltransferase T